jgi:hypothetical protein
MSGLRRSTPAKQIAELTRRLAEEYVSVPLPDVSRIVNDAAAIATGPDGDWGGTTDGIPAIVEVIDHLAREDLDGIRVTPVRRRPAKPGPTGPAQRGARRSGPRRGAA